ncbi:hypothetical protein V8D89_004156 [Ganoderma adspersum]
MSNWFSNSRLANQRARLDAGPVVAKTERKIDAIEDRMGNLAIQVSPATSLLKEAASTDLAQQIERGIQRFADNIPWLMKSLDELARIHPAVTVAVLAFRAVYALESTRQENDRRVATLYVEMKDMMMVMVQLRRIATQTHVGLDGKVLKDRLQELAEKTAEDIKQCANVCDTFLKKGILVKFFKGPVWADRLAGFVKVFAARKGEFQLALDMHTANSLADVKEQNYEVQAKLNTVLELFKQQFATPEECKIAIEVQRIQRGGAATGTKVREGDDILGDCGARKVQQDDDLLKALIAVDPFTRRDDPKEAKAGTEKDAQGAVPPHARKDPPMSGKQKPLTLDQLKAELREDIDDALERNLSFLRTALEKYIHAESDWVIGAVTDVVTQGPYMKIKDPELRRIWQEMNWRGNVKARLFVLTLQDHYRDEFEQTAHAAGAVSTDQWDLRYLNAQGLGPIIEAFDDDASGYVTITEVNKLMDLRPPSLEWSVPHWLAYLAIAANAYIERIRTILVRMKDTIPTVLPVNLKILDAYFDIWWWILMLLHGVSLNLDNDDVLLSDRFQEYTDMEEQRIRKNLEKIKYYIDASDTLFLVVGSGNLDKAVRPPPPPLLENDWVKFSAAQKYPLDPTLFDRAQHTIWKNFDVLSNRRDDLERRFTHERLDLKKQFKSFACGLLGHIPYSDHAGFRLPPITDNEDFKAEGVEFWGDSFTVTGMVEPEEDGVFRLEWKKLYPDGDIFYYFGTLIDECTITGWLGQSVEYFPWQFFLKKIPAEHMIYRPSPHTLGLLPPPLPSTPAFMPPTAHPTAVGTNGGSTAHPISDEHADETSNADKMEADGDAPGDAGLNIDTPSEPEDRTDDEASGGPEAAASTHGRLTPDADGSSTADPSQSTQVLRRKYCALWQYAISAIRHDIRRKWWTWSYFAARRYARKNYLKTHQMLNGTFPYDPDHDLRVSEASLALTSRDARFYEALAVHLSKLQPYPLRSANGADDMWCPSEPRAILASSSGNINAFDLVPRHPVSAARLICLDCEPDPKVFCTWVMFCDDERCFLNPMQTPLNVGVPPHKCAHDLVKVRTVVHRLAWGPLRQKARNALRCLPWNPAPPDPPPVELANEGGPRQDLVGSVGEFGRAPEDDAGGVPSSSTSSSNTSPRRRDAAVSSTQLNADIDRPVAEDQAGLTDGSVRPRGLDASIQAGGQSFKEKIRDGDLVVTGEEAPGEVHTDTLSSHRSTSNSNFICVGCESKTLISCYDCRRPFPQPRWYYGPERNDFICDMCFAYGLKGPDPSTLPPGYDPAYSDYGLHVYTHPLVRCRRKEAGAAHEPVTDSSVEETGTETDRRLASVEKRLLAMDAKFERFESRFDDLEKQLARLEKKQESMQDALLERFAKTLVNVLSRNMSINVDGQAP